jgi:hypothetical protein
MIVLTASKKLSFITIPEARRQINEADGGAVPDGQALGQAARAHNPAAPIAKKHVSAPRIVKDHL